jgi:protein-tyrosine phosphatase
MKILIVCLGNICRSPLGEAILQQKAIDNGLPWQVDSAGTNHYHIGEPPHHLSQKVALMNGLDISQQRSRQVTAEDFQQYDRIYAMAADVMDDLRRIGNDQFESVKTQMFLGPLFPGQNKDVPDPWYGPEPGYHEVFDLISRGAEAIINDYLATSGK